MREKAFFKENETKLVKLFYFEESWKNGEIQEHVFPWTCVSRVANFIHYMFGWWLLLLYTIFFVASASPAKCYSRPWLCSRLFSEETLWVACEKLFLEVLDYNNNNNKKKNNNNNNNDNNNNDNSNNNNDDDDADDLFASSIFTMALREC